MLCGVVLLLCLCGTLIEVAQGYLRSAVVPLRKSDGFMPVSNESPSEESFTAQKDVNTKIGSHTVASDESVAFLVYPERKSRECTVKTCSVMAHDLNYSITSSNILKIILVIIICKCYESNLFSFKICILSVLESVGSLFCFC